MALFYGAARAVIYLCPMTSILKIGGNVLASPELLAQALQYFISLPSPAILVHGGGKEASQLATQLGIVPKMVDGRRITDAPTLKVVTMVYAGLVNKRLVAQLQALGCNAIGLSGADGNLIRAHQRPVGIIDYGFAGDIDIINTQTLTSLLSAGLSPVCCAITHNQRGQLLNTNADTIASTLAQALAPTTEVSLQYCFEKAGVLKDADKDDSVIPFLPYSHYQQLKEKGNIHSGMIPKLDNAFAALQAGAQEVIIGNIDSFMQHVATQLK